MKSRPLDTSAENFTKTSIQKRAQGIVKPKAYNAWDILALNDMIKGQIDEQKRREREHQQRIDMRHYYDGQVDHKRKEKEVEKQIDRSLGQTIKDHVQQVAKLAEMDDNKRKVARGKIAVENRTKVDIARKEQFLVENRAKIETIRTLEANSLVNAHRNQLQKQIKEQNRRVQME